MCKENFNKKRPLPHWKGFQWRILLHVRCAMSMRAYYYNNRAFQLWHIGKRFSSHKDLLRMFLLNWLQYIYFIFSGFITPAEVSQFTKNLKFTITAYLLVGTSASTTWNSFGKLIYFSQTDFIEVSISWN